MCIKVHIKRKERNKYMVGDKKILNLQILNILKEHSDSKNRLTQSDIKEYLEKEYDQVGIDGRTINANIDILNEFLKDVIEYRTEKMKSKGSTIEKRYDYYLIRDFDESELRLVIDSILSSKSIPENQCEQLIEKLRKEASLSFKYKKDMVKKYTSGLKANEEIFMSIEVIGDAIEEKKKVKFKYYDYNINKEWVARKDKDAKDKIYKLTPLRMVVNNGRYYLFGVPDIYDKWKNSNVDENDYTLSIGRSNRDFDFLVKAWKQPCLSKRKLVIISDMYHPTEPVPNNIKLLNTNK